MLFLNQNVPKGCDSCSWFQAYFLSGSSILSLSNNFNIVFQLWDIFEPDWNRYLFHKDPVDFFFWNRFFNVVVNDILVFGLISQSDLHSCPASYKSTLRYINKLIRFWWLYILSLLCFSFHFIKVIIISKHSHQIVCQSVWEKLLFIALGENLNKILKFIKWIYS